MDLIQIEEPSGARDGADGVGLSVGIELSALGGVAVAASMGGNAEMVVKRDGAAAKKDASESELAVLFANVRSLAEKALAQPVTHAVVVLNGISVPHGMVMRAAAEADIALLGIRDGGSALDAAVEAEDIAGVLSR
jgi:hypothetical protein